jgi:serine/threonine protein kinase/tetratricopeptide (TPR) repeat protein
MFCPLDGTKLELSSTPITEDPELEKRVVDEYPSLFGAGADGEDEDEEDSESAPSLEATGIEPENAAAALIGTIIDKHYEIMSIIGSGGMSVVYVAKDIRLKKIVALKMMLPHLVANPLSMQRFQQEAEAASNLNHPNVVGVHNFGVSKSTQPYLIMDYCQGISLGNLIALKGRLDLDRAVPIFVQIASALSHAHEKGVIHRDLKPSNILVAETPEHRDLVKIVDFGIAKILPQEGREAAQLTQTGEIFGSPMYMSPEQCRGERLDARSDIYSMGCVMYETLTGGPPIEGANMLEILFKHINEMPPRLTTTASGLPFPAKLEAIVFKTLAKDPNERYQTMTALREDLVRYQREQTQTFMDTIAARFQINWHKRKVWKRSEQIAFGIALGAFLLAGVLGTWLTTLYVMAANSPYANIELTWKENTPPPDPVPSAAAVAQANAAVMKWKSEADGVSQNAKEYPAGAYTFIEDEVKKLNNSAEDDYNEGLWEQAAQLYSIALGLLDQRPDKHSDALIAPESTLPIRKMHANIALCYFKTKQYSLAAQNYSDLINLEPNIIAYTRAEHRAMQGDCYYFQKNWVEADSSYENARGIWMNTENPQHQSDSSDAVGKKHYCLAGWYVPIENTLVLITTARQADCCRNLGPSGSPKFPKVNYFVKSAYLYHQCAISYGQQQEANNPYTQNLAVSHYYLAETAQKLTPQQFANLKSNDLPAEARKMTVDDYYKKSCEEMRQAVGDRSPLLAKVLKGYSDYLFTKFDYLNGLRYRVESLQVLSQANDKGSGPSPHS